MKIKNSVWNLLFVIYTGYAITELYFFGHYITTLQEGHAPPTLSDYIYELVMLTVLIGFFGFITSKKILNVYFWRGLFIIAVAFEAFEIITGIIELGTSYFNIFIEPWWSLLLYLAVIPAFIAIYKYSFRSGKVWE